MKKIILFLCFWAFTVAVFSQKKSLEYSFYGFMRGDLYCNSRSNTEVVDGLFYLYPNDIAEDGAGKDMNAMANGSFYTFTTRLGMDMKMPDLGSAKTSAKIETDFGGTTNLNFMLRLRQAYIKFDWDKGSSLLLGQTWHPLFGDIAPDILNLSTGSPFQPFNRSPMINYQYRSGGLKLTAAAVYQLIYASIGPDGRNEKYIKDGVMPEFYAGVDYVIGGFAVGGGADFISLRPRLRSAGSDGKTYGVDERVNALSWDIHAAFKTKYFRIAAKSVLADNQTHNTMLGGFGVTSVDKVTGKQDYVPFRHSTSWLNIVYGDKVQTGFFAGYTKNLGTSKSLVSTDKLYGMGLNIDRLSNYSIFLRYALNDWRLGLEYTLTTAWYGVNDLSNGKVRDTHDVSNHRLEAVFMYYF